MSSIFGKIKGLKKEKILGIGSRVRLKGDKSYLGTVIKFKPLSPSETGYVIQWDKYNKGDVYAYPLSKFELV